MAVGTKIQGNYKIDVTTKRRIDLLSSALGVDRGRVVDEAISLLAKEKAPDLQEFLDLARASLDGSSDLTPGELFTGKRRSKDYVGGPVKR